MMGKVGKKILMIPCSAALILATACEDTGPEPIGPYHEMSLIEHTARKLVNLQSNILRINGDNLIALTSAFGRVKNNDFGPNGKINDDSLAQVIPDVCGEVSVRLDDNGLDKVQVDYRNGCEVEGRLLKGKVTYLYRRNERGMEFEIIFENYSDQPSGEDLAPPSVLNGHERGSYQRLETGIFAEFNETEVDLTYPDGSFEQFRSEGQYELTDNTLKITKYAFTLAVEGEDQYTGRVLNSMSLDYDCDDAFVPISGIEKFTYNDEEFFVDYGDDTCDKAIALTWNAETNVIQMGNG